MKILHFAVAAAILAGAAQPAAAQMGGLGVGHEFIQAVRERNGGRANELIQGNPPGILNARDSDGNTPLLIAVGREDTEWTSFLLLKGADANLPNKDGDTPLIMAARTGFTDAADWLLEMGAKVDGANRMGETALIVAVQQRQAPLVRRLLEAGANPDRQDSAAGYSARDYALRDTRSRQILQLIEAKKPKTAASR